MPTVSIIVPNYNHARFLRQRIETILAQTFQDFELILLDDGSTDDSAKILREYASDARARRAGVRLEINAVNSGSPFAQWNKGARLARGQYVWMAESDDYADPRLLERLVPTLDADPQTTFAYCRSHRAGASGETNGLGDWYLELVDAERWGGDFCVDGRTGFLPYLAGCCVVANASAVLFRKSVYERIGGADESLRLCGDWKVWAGMALEGKVGFASEPLNYYRVHAGGAFQKAVGNATAVTESLAVVQWILERTVLSNGELARAYSLQASGWVPALMSLRIPIRQKREILRRVREFDPHPARRVLTPARKTLQLKLLRYWRDLRLATASKKAGVKPLGSTAKGSCN